MLCLREAEGIDIMAMVDVKFRLEEKLKKDMEAVCSNAGLSIEDAFILFIKKVVNERRIPFELSLNPVKNEVANDLEYIYHGIDLRIFRINALFYEKANKEERMAVLQDMESSFSKFIGDRLLSPHEMQCFLKWAEWGCSASVFYMILEKMIAKTGKPRMSYLDVMIKNHMQKLAELELREKVLSAEDSRLAGAETYTAEDVSKRLKAQIDGK